ncbi:MAG: zinc ribbon domain-containing protein [Candidatus Bathyarchaeia archaeon]
MGKELVNYGVGEAFSAGLGLAMGLMISQSMFQIMQPSQRIAKQVVVCLKCGGKNPVENKFCGHCGKALYPPAPITCPSCGALMSSHMNFCGECGSPLKSQNKKKEKIKRS